MPKKINSGQATATEPKPKAAKPKAEPKPKAAKPKSESKGLMPGIERDHDVPWNDKKVAVFKALKALKATSAVSAKSAIEIAQRVEGLNTRTVRHYCYHAKAAGLIDVAQLEGVRGYSFYLTAKGQEIDPVKALKEQSADK